MLQGTRVGATLGMAIMLVAWSHRMHGQNLADHLPLLKTSQSPSTFGIKDGVTTTISATSFVPDDNAIGYFTSASLGRGTALSTHAHYYATLNIPAGVVIDFVGLNSTTDTDSIIGVALWRRFGTGAFVMLTGFSAPAHGWQTDYVGPLNQPFTNDYDQELVVDVEVAPSPTFEYFAFVTVQWHRIVSPAPVFASFADVPPSSPQFQFVEALVRAGITAGCGGGNYCPDAAVTRGQMAVFLATALGLHWPG